MSFSVQPKRTIRNVFVMLVAVLAVFGIFRLTGAGSLTPTLAPAATMHDLQELYSVLVGTFDSSSIVPAKQGDAFQVTKCIIQKIKGSPCP